MYKKIETPWIYLTSSRSRTSIKISLTPSFCIQKIIKHRQGTLGEKTKRIRKIWKNSYGFFI